VVKMKELNAFMEANDREIRDILLVIEGVF
jgi:hypothetical protein